ncbi:MAG: cellulose synthase operon protein YhjQ/BcsQ [Gallionellaceae bacterium]|nr:cellulose synthase operon protein YhjQ/BcsQ [Gallionellaceae bacterium]
MRFDPLIDQADGLRRMLARSNARVVTVVGARSGLGATSVVLNLASAWAWSGKEVLILDEHLTTNNVANSLALKPRYDLLNVVRGDKTLHQVMLRAGDGVKVLPVARATIALPKLDEVERERFSSTLTHAARGMDVVLVDASARAFSSVSTSLSGDEPMLLVLTGTASGITESYSMLKQMTRQNGRQVFDIVVNKVKNEAEARAIFDNMALLAERNLQVQLVYMGYIPVDEKLQRATQLCRPVMEAFPRSPCAIAFNELAQNLVQVKSDLDAEEVGLANIMQRLMRQTSPNRVVSAIT